ncbi:MAG: hypothetical protein RL758_2323 [Pseudomonadota bacterium]
MRPSAKVVPGWLPAQAPWPVGVQAGISLRTGGVSASPWSSLNLGDHVGDQPGHVAANRQRLADFLGASPTFCQQVHGTDIVQLGPESTDGCVADGAWTAHPNQACTMMVADCLPILVAAPDGTSVAALHAGWRGLVGQGGVGVIEALVHAWPALCDPEVRRECVVWLGPCIGPTAFEVGAEVRQAFLAHDPKATDCFHHLNENVGVPKFFADLPGLARRRLAQAGLPRVYGNDGSSGWCTVLNPDRFFSFRRDQARFGGTGRMAACIWRA